MAKYLRNCWYAAAFTEEVTRKPLARTLLGEKLVMYRKEDGSVALLSDTCPHRFAPMSEGILMGDEIRCPYHGLRFNSDGQCTDNPHSTGNPPPKAACLKSYKTMDKYGFIWFWAGDSEKLDESLLPDFYYLEQPETFRVIHGLLHVKGNYQLVIDNLLDLTHAPYLHPQFAMPGITIEQQLAHTESKLIREERSVTAYRLRTGLPPNGPTIELFGFRNEPVNTRTHMHWHPPALIDFDNASWYPHTDPDEGLRMPQAHIMTPETETTCHYFYAATRNMLMESDEADTLLRGVLESAFRDQDEPMIEMIQQRMGTADLLSLNPVLLSTDGAPMAARRMLDKLISEESGN